MPEGTAVVSATHYSFLAVISSNEPSCFPPVQWI